MELTIPLTTLVVLVVLALAFDFMNGFHDAANSIATVVSTGVLRPYQAVLWRRSSISWDLFFIMRNHQAVLWAAFFNFVAIFIFHLKVAAMVGKGIVDPVAIDHYVIFGALIGAIAWNLITWYYGIPSSSSHALIGGMIGATIAKAGTGPLLTPGIVKTATFIIVSPLLGLTLGALIMIAVSWICLRAAPQRVDRWFRRLQLVSSAALQHRARQQRRAEDHGHHLAIADHRRRHDEGSSAVLGDRLVLHRHCDGDDVRWLAHRQDDGPEDHEAASGRRIRGRNGRCDHVVHGVGVRHPRLDDTHDHGRDHRLSARHSVRAPCAGASRANIVFAWIVTMPAAAVLAAVAYYIGRAVLVTETGPALRSRRRSCWVGCRRDASMAWHRER